MKRGIVSLSFFLCLLLNGCESGVEKFFSDFFNQASGDWKSNQITVLSSETNDLLPAKLSIKLTECTASPCTVSISVDNGEYIDMQYTLGQGSPEGTTEMSAMVLGFNRYSGNKDSLSEKEIFFIENVQNFFIENFSSTKLDTDIIFQSGIALNAIFIPE